MMSPAAFLNVRKLPVLTTLPSTSFMPESFLVHDRCFPVRRVDLAQERSARSGRGILPFTGMYTSCM
jgi:hypothetical protein